MKKWISLLLIGLLIFLAHTRRPLLDTHLNRIYWQATGQQAPPADLRARAGWNALTWHDWFVVTVTQDPRTRTLVSFGFGNYIKVLDTKWAARELAPQQSPGTE